MSRGGHYERLLESKWDGSNASCMNPRTHFDNQLRRRDGALIGSEQAKPGRRAQSRTLHTNDIGSNITDMSNVSRRTFFQGAALAFSASRVIGANDRINVGLIGIGGRGTDHLKSYVKIQDCRIAALCDVNQAARERAQARLKTETSTSESAKEYRTMRDLFADKEIDAVSIATPNHWHALATIWACQAGKDV